MKILITGGRGKLASAFQRVADTDHTIIMTDRAGQTGPALDFTDYDQTCRVIEAEKPDVVLHAAAWTDVDGCARDPERALRINAHGAQNVAVASAAIGASIVYVSSNEVFDGLAKRPYYEYDTCQPANPYGFSKYAGERAVIEVNPCHYIVRTAWLFAHGGRNFIHAILGAVQAGKSLRVVVDEVANPTYTEDVASAIAQLIPTGRYGTYHFVNEGAVSRFTFARYVLDHCGYSQTPIEPISRHEWARPSVPPLYAALANVSGSAIGVRLRDWQSAVDAFLQAESLYVAPDVNSAS